MKLKEKLGQRFGQLGTWLFWKNALQRAGRTAAVVALPYFGATAFADVSWLTVASAAGFGAFFSFVTSLGGLVEAGGGQVAWWYAAGERVVKTFFQALATGLGTATMFEQVDWQMVLQGSLLSAGGSLLLAFVTKLPEADTLPSAVQAVTQIDDTFTSETTQGTTINSPSLAPEMADVPLGATNVPADPAVHPGAS